MYIIPPKATKQSGYFQGLGHHSVNAINPCTRMDI